MKKETSNKPIEAMGKGVTAKLFANTTKDGKTFDKVQIVRVYKDDEGFKSTPTFTIDELPLVCLYAQKMYEIGIQRRIERLEQEVEEE